MVVVIGTVPVALGAGTALTALRGQGINDTDLDTI